MSQSLVGQAGLLRRPPTGAAAPVAEPGPSSSLAARYRAPAPECDPPSRSGRAGSAGRTPRQRTKGSALEQRVKLAVALFTTTGLGAAIAEGLKWAISHQQECLILAEGLVVATGIALLVTALLGFPWRTLRQQCGSALAGALLICAVGAYVSLPGLASVVTPAKADPPQHLESFVALVRENLPERDEAGNHQWTDRPPTFAAFREFLIEHYGCDLDNADDEEAVMSVLIFSLAVDRIASLDPVGSLDKSRRPLEALLAGYQCGQVAH